MPARKREASKPAPLRIEGCDTRYKQPPLETRSFVTINCSVGSEKQARRYFVSGLVQGVGYRYFTQDAAERLHLTGYVRNLRDGRVEAYAIGTAEQLSRLRNALEKGPR